MTPNQELVERWQDFWVEVEATEEPDIAQFVNGKWYVPKFGCDSLEMTIKSLSHQKALSRAEVLEEVRGKVEEMKKSEEPNPLGNPTFPYARRDHARAYNQSLSDTLAVVHEIKNKEGV